MMIKKQEIMKTGLIGEKLAKLVLSCLGFLYFLVKFRLAEPSMGYIEYKLCFCSESWKTKNSTVSRKMSLASGGERRDAQRRVDRLRKLPVTVIWANRTTS